MNLGRNKAMNKNIKTLALITTGLVVGVVLGRVRKNESSNNIKFNADKLVSHLIKGK